MYLYVVKDGHGNITNQYWDSKSVSGIEQVINMHSSRTPLGNGWSQSNKDAVILNIIEVTSKPEVNICFKG